MVAASWTHEEDASKIINRKDLPDVVLVRKVSRKIYTAYVTFQRIGVSCCPHQFMSLLI